MKMKLKKSLILSSSILLVGGLVVGCGSSQESSGSGGSQSTVTIKFMHFKSDQTDGINKIVQAFEKKYPNIHVDVTPEKYDDYYTLLQTKIASGDDLDVFTINAGDRTQQYLKAGYLLDLTGQPFLNNIQDNALKAQAVNGKNYILPVNNGVLAMFYNKKIFKDLGLSVPTTYSELMADAKKIQAAGITPFALGYKDAWTLAMFSGRDLIQQVFLGNNQPNWGADVVSGSTSFKSTTLFNNVVNHTQDFYKYGNKDQLGVDYNGSMDLFASGKAAMTYEGMWILPEIEKRDPDFYNNNLGLFAYPATDDPKQTKLEVDGDASLAVYSKSKHQKEALEFMDFMASKEAGDLWVDNIKTLSEVKGTKTDFAPVMNDAKPYFDSGNVFDSAPYYGQLPGGWDGELGKQITPAFYNKATTQTIAEAMDKFVQNSKK